METVFCRACGKPLATDVRQCPSCGQPSTSASAPFAPLLWIMAGALALVIGAGFVIMKSDSQKAKEIRRALFGEPTLGEAIDEALEQTKAP